MPIPTSRACITNTMLQIVGGICTGDLPTVRGNTAYMPSNFLNKVKANNKFRELFFTKPFAILTNWKN